MKLKTIKLPFLQKRFDVSNRFITQQGLFLTILLFIPLALSSQVIRKTGVSFKAEDGLVVIADSYVSQNPHPFVILFHTEGSSRAEYNSIAERLMRLNVNCLAVDLRSGGRHEFTINETARLAKENGFNTSLYESVKDVHAAIDYVKKESGKPVILMGSSYSASLSLIAAKDNPDVKAVIAFSPGEFFLPGTELAKILTEYKNPVFAGFSTEEYPYFAGPLEDQVNDNIILFKPSYGPGKRTVEALNNASPNAEEYWFALLIFFRSLL